MFFMKKYGRGFLLAGIPLFLVSCGGCSLGFMGTAQPDQITLLSYNVQNLFDDVRDGTEYEEFIPGEGEWNEELFHLKMLQLSEVINRHPAGGADIVLLQEVENRNALDTLNTHYLKGAGYGYSFMSDGEGLAVNSAVLSRYPVTDVVVHSVSLEGKTGGRPVLEAHIEAGGLKLVLFNCHWKSKSGGAEETEVFRRAAAAVVSRSLSRLRAVQPDMPAVVAGDLNENFDEWTRIEGAYPTALRVHGGLTDGDFADGDFTEASEVPGSDGAEGTLYLVGSFDDMRDRPDTRTESDGGEEEISGFRLFSPWLGYTSFPGSYAYRGGWETIDHFLLNSALGNDAGLEYAGFEVVHPDMILDDEGYPMRWISGTAEGYSDHLPLLLTLELREG